MKKCFFLAALLATLLAGRAAAQGADATFDKKTDFSKFKTYKWVTIKDALQLDELTAEQLIGTLDTALAKKGLSNAKSDSPDLLIGYQIVRSGQKHLNDYNVGGAYGSSVGATTATAGVTSATVHSGELVLDMYDATTKQLVWRAVVSKMADADAKPAKKQKQMDKTVEKLLKNYPPAKS